jgi:hypothetical protein
VFKCALWRMRREFDAECLFETAAILTWFTVRRFVFFTLRGRFIFALIVFVVAAGCAFVLWVVVALVVHVAGGRTRGIRGLFLVEVGIVRVGWVSVARALGVVGVALPGVDSVDLAARDVLLLAASVVQ